MNNAEASETCPIAALRNDHRRAMRLVGLLLERMDRLRKLNADDVLITHDIFRYMVGFVDGRHHAREDRVIEAMLRRDPRLRCHLDHVAQAHDELKAEGDALLGELAAMRESRRGGASRLLPRLADYVAALSRHFQYEEEELFARAEQILKEDDWARIEAPGDDPLFGPRVEQSFEALFQAYVGRVREIGAPSRVPGPTAAAVWVDSAAALIGGARETASAIVAGSRRAWCANFAGVGVMAQSRSLLDFAAATSAWTSETLGETRSAVRRIRDLATETTCSTFEPVGSALSGSSRPFAAASHRVDRTPPSWQAHLVNLGLRALFKRGVQNVDIESVRQPRSNMERLMSAIGSDVLVDRYPLGPAEIEIFEIKGVKPERTLLHLPGGGFIMAPTQAHRLMAARIARQARARVVLVYYRLAPENPYPAGLDDCVAAYDHLLATGIDAGEIVVLGDSAGGGLALSLLLRLRDGGRPLPAAGIAVSPVTDLSYSGASRSYNRWIDPTLPNDDRNVIAELYLCGTPPDDPLVSPLFGDLAGLPPILLQVGSIEVLLDDSLRFAAKVRSQGGECECEVWHGMPHDWLLFGMLPEAKKALANVVEFVRRHTSVRAPAETATSVAGGTADTRPAAAPVRLRAA